MDKRRKRAEKQKKRDAARRRSHAATAAGPAGSAGGPEREQAVRELLVRADEASRSGNFEKAERLFRKGLKLDPNHPQGLTNFAVAFEREGRTEDAIAICRKAVERNPDYAAAHNTLGALLKVGGEVAEAEVLFRRAVELEPGDASAWRNLTTVKRYSDPRDPDLALLEALLAALPRGDAGHVELNFALGKAYEDLAEYDRSFEHYAAGNRARRAQVVYRTADFDAFADRTIAAHDAEFLAPVAMREPADGPILVVGMPRSGTTLVEQILASHPRVRSVGEVLDLDDVLRAAGGGSAGIDPGRIAGLADAELARLARLYRARLEQRIGPETSSAPRIVDKCLQNFVHIGFVARALPGARIVHVLRDPIDNGFACFKMLFANAVHFSYDLTEIGERYRGYMRMMDHWRAALPDLILDVRYEDVVADQERETRRLLAHCGLEWDDACLRFHEARRRVGSASAAQVRRPIYSSSIEKWRRYEAHLGPLIEALGPYGERPASPPPK